MDIIGPLQSTRVRGQAPLLRRPQVQLHQSHLTPPPKLPMPVPRLTGSDFHQPACTLAASGTPKAVKWVFHPLFLIPYLFAASMNLPWQVTGICSLPQCSCRALLGKARHSLPLEVSTVRQPSKAVPVWWILYCLCEAPAALQSSKRGCW